jgi:hypothetical protein
MIKIERHTSPIARGKQDCEFKGLGGLRAAPLRKWLIVPGLAFGYVARKVTLCGTPRH